MKMINMTEIKKFCKENNLTEDQFFGKTKIEGSLYLRSVTSIPDGCSFNVGEYLDLSSLKSIPDGCSFTVGGCLYLSSVTSIPDGCSFTVGRHLYLSSLTSIPDGCSFTVGWNLNLRSLTSIPDGCSFTVGGSLDLRSGLTCSTLPCPSILSWQDGRYIKCDGLFMEVISKRKNVWKVKSLNKDEISYIVTDGNDRYSHGVTIKDAKASLIFKISDRDPSKYEHLTVEDSLSKEEMIGCYRVITGACEFGVKEFIQRKLNGEMKKQYKIQDVITITENEYGHQQFKEFFNK